MVSILVKSDQRFCLFIFKAINSICIMPERIVNHPGHQFMKEDGLSSVSIKIFFVCLQGLCKRKMIPQSGVHCALWIIWPWLSREAQTHVRGSSGRVFMIGRILLKRAI